MYHCGYEHKHVLFLAITSGFSLRECTCYTGDYGVKQGMDIEAMPLQQISMNVLFNFQPVKWGCG